MNPDTALITGASSGIGLHLAHEFARQGHPLVLVARVYTELEAIAAELTRTYSASVRIIAGDLEDPRVPSAIFDALQQASITVDILVNNAGRGCCGKFWEIPLEHDLSMLHLNVEAMLRLTKLFLPPMIARGRGRILNTSSIAGFAPGPRMAVYHATKAFVLSWSEALAIEMEGTPITVTALCPGATDTDFFPKAGMEGTRAFQTQPLSAPQEVAKSAYEGLMSGELFVVPGGMNKVLVAARRVLTQEAAAKLNLRLYEEVPSKNRKRHRGDMEAAATKV